MKNKLILHIGMPKTGTTSIEGFLYNNNPLLESLGYCYPVFKDDKDTQNGCVIYDYMIGGRINSEHPGWNKLWNDIRCKLETKNVIFSSESIWIFDTSHIISLIKKEYDNVKVIVYLRRQDLYLESAYNQRIKKENLCQSIDEYSYIKKFELNYLEKLDKISNIVGRENLIVRVYEKEQFEGEKHDVISDFLKTLNINMDSKFIKAAANRNASLYGNFIEIKRIMNSILYNNEDMTSEMHKILARGLSLNKNDKVRNSEGFFTDSQRQEILDYYKKENEEIARKYLNREDGILFYDNRSIKKYELDINTLLSDTKYVCYMMLENLKDSLLAIDINKARKFDGIRNIVNVYQEQLGYFSYVKKMVEINFNELEKCKHYDNGKLKEACFSAVKMMTSLFIQFKEAVEELNGIVDATNIIYKKDKKIVLFGGGLYCGSLLKYTKLDIDFIVDNGVSMEGDSFCGIKVINPSNIDNWNDKFVIITCSNNKYIAEIELQLNNYGLKKYKDYILGTSIFCNGVW